jgi:hypothetical protein
MQLYEPERHEAPTRSRWSEARAREAIGQIADATLSALRPGGLWRCHDENADDGVVEEPTTLWLGAAGTVWALAELGIGQDLPAVAERNVTRFVDEPDFDGLDIDHTYRTVDFW